MARVEQAVERHQARVSAHFDAQAGYWREIYTGGAPTFESVGNLVIRERHEAALAWIDRLALPAGARVLEVGAGAGMLSIALARRGFRVTATDAAEEMVRLIARNAVEGGVSGSLTAAAADATALAFADDSFDLVVALGVVSWLARPEDGVRELARVVRPGGHVLLTTFNRMQLIALLDPLRNPWVRPPLLALKRTLERVRLRPQAATLTYLDRQFVNGVVAGTGLERTRACTLGFGPFSFFHKELLPPGAAKRVHHVAQRLADAGVPGLRHAGMFYLVLAQKPARP